MPDALQAVFVGLNTPTWHLLPVPLTQRLVQELVSCRALAGSEAYVLADTIRGPGDQNR